MNAYSFVRTRSQNLPFRESLGASRINRILSVHGHSILEEKKKKPPKSSMKLGEGHSKDSFQDLLRTVWNKPHTAPANQVLGTEKRHAMLPAQHTSELSLRPSREFWT